MLYRCTVFAIIRNRIYIYTLAFTFVTILYRFGKFWKQNLQKLYGQSSRGHRKFWLSTITGLD